MKAIHEQCLDLFHAELAALDPVPATGPPRFFTEEWLVDFEQRGHAWLRRKLLKPEPARFDEVEEEELAVQYLSGRLSTSAHVNVDTDIARAGRQPIAHEAAAISLMGKLAMTPLFTQYGQRLTDITNSSCWNLGNISESITQSLIPSCEPQSLARLVPPIAPRTLRTESETISIDVNIIEHVARPIDDFNLERAEIHHSRTRSAATSTSEQQHLAARPPVRPQRPSDEEVRIAFKAAREYDLVTSYFQSGRSRPVDLSAPFLTTSNGSALVDSLSTSTILNPSDASISLQIDPVQLEKVLAQAAFDINKLRSTESRDLGNTSAWTRLPSETSGLAKVFRSKPDPNHVPKLWKRKTLDAYLFQVYEMTKDIEPREQYRYIQSPPSMTRQDFVVETHAQGRHARPEATPIQPFCRSKGEVVPLVRVPARGDSNATVEQLRHEAGRLSLRGQTESIGTSTTSKAVDSNNKSFKRLFSFKETSRRKASYDFIEAYCEPRAETVDTITGQYLAKGRAIEQTNSMVIRSEPSWINRSKIKRGKDLAVEAAQFDRFASLKKFAAQLGLQRVGKQIPRADEAKLLFDEPCLPVLGPGLTGSPTTTGCSTPSTVTDSWDASSKDVQGSWSLLDSRIKDHLAGNTSRNHRRQAVYVVQDELSSPFISKQQSNARSYGRTS